MLLYMMVLLLLLMMIPGTPKQTQPRHTSGGAGASQALGWEGGGVGGSAERNSYVTDKGS